MGKLNPKELKRKVEGLAVEVAGEYPEEEYLPIAFDLLTEGVSNIISEIKKKYGLVPLLESSIELVESGDSTTLRFADFGCGQHADLEEAAECIVFAILYNMAVSLYHKHRKKQGEPKKRT